MGPSEATTQALWSAVVVAAAAFGLGVVGLAHQPPGGRLLDLIYNSLQLFVLGSDRLQGMGPYPWQLEVARLLAPATTLIAVLVALRALLGHELRRRRVAGMAGHSIVCGDGPEALTLARNLQAKGTSVVLVRSAAAEQLRREPFPAVIGDAKEASTLCAAGLRGSRTLYACDPLSATNAAVALGASALAVGRSNRLTAFAQVLNEDLVEAFGARRMASPRTPGVTIDFFSLDGIAARALIEQHPPEPGPPAVLGLGTLGEAVVRAIVRRPADTGATVFIVGAEPGQVAELAARLDAARRGWTIRPGGETDISRGLLYVCISDQDAALTTGLRLARTEEDRQVVVCLRRASPFRDALDAGTALRIFGVLDEACTADAIAQDSIVGLTARAIHDSYVLSATRRGDTPDTNSSLVSWGELPAHLQESNYAQAEHIGTKLIVIGASLTTVPSRQTFTFSAAEIDRLAQMEHQRWMDERRAAGFVHGPHRTDVTHPDLVDWSDLPRESRQKDLDAIAAIPDLLASRGLYVKRASVKLR